MIVDGEVVGTRRPYTPPSNVTGVLQRLRSRNLPDRVDAEYLRDAGVPEGTITRTLFALEFLGLVEEGEPTQALRSIAISTDEEYQAILSGLVRQAYEDVFKVIDPAQDSQDRIVNFFRRYTPASQRDRMVIFFLGMCREAGIPTLDAPRQRSSAAQPKLRTAKGEPRSPRRALPAPKTERGAKRQEPEFERPANDGARGQTLFGIMESDIALLEEQEFNEVWAALGRVARARARAQRGPVKATPASDDGELVYDLMDEEDT